jgi:hypothetical protein
MGLRFHLVDGQGIRIWYRNLTLVTRPVEYQDRAGFKPYLFWITPGCDVHEITLPDLQVRSVQGNPEYASYQRALRGYALGSWSVGEADRGISALLRMEEKDRVSWDFDRRLAAALLLSTGRARDAQRITSSLPKLGNDAAVAGAAVALTTYVLRPGLDDAVFQVFGVDTRDPETFRSLMMYFSDQVLLDKAQRMAQRLLVLHPGDEDATAMIEAIRKVPKWQQVLVGPGSWAPTSQAY